MNRTIKISGITTAILLLVPVLIYFVLSAGLLNQWIAKKISDSASKQLNGNLTIGAVKGSPLSEFILEDINFIYQGKSNLSIKRTEIGYKPVKLLHKKVWVEKLYVSGLTTSLSEEANGSWNFSNWQLQDSTKSTVQKNKQLPFNWLIMFDELRLDSTNISINSENKNIPENLNLNASANFSYAENSLQVRLKEFRLVTLKPEFMVRSFSLDFSQNEDTIRWDNLNLMLSATQIFSNGIIPLARPEGSHVVFNASPLDLDDFKVWLPNISGKPQISIKLSEQNGKSQINIEASENIQKLSIVGTASDMINIPDYNFEINTDSINLATWMNDPEYKTCVSGILNISGKGMNLKDNLIDLKACFNDLEYSGYEINGLYADIQKNNSRITAELNAGTLFGQISSNFEIDSLQANPDYKIHVNLQNFNLSKLLMEKKFKSDLNLNLNAHGKGTDIETLISNIEIQSNNSSLFDEPITDFNTSIKLNNGFYKINRFLFKTPSILFTLKGKGDIHSENFLEYSMDVENSNPISALLGYENFSFCGNSKGNITGPSHELKIESKVTLKNLMYDSIWIKDAMAEAQAVFSGDSLTFKNLMASDKSFFNHFNAEKISARAEAFIEAAGYGNIGIEKFTSGIKFMNDSLDGYLNTKIMDAGMDIIFNADNLFSVPTYTAEAYINGFNISKLFPERIFYSDINLKLNAKGKGSAINDIIAEISVESDGSTFQDLAIDNFMHSLNFEKGTYSLKDWKVNTPAAGIQISGQGGMINHDLTYRIYTNDFNSHASKFNLKGTKIEAWSDGRIFGHYDSLFFLNTTEISNFHYDTLNINSFSLKTDFSKIDSLFNGYLNINSSHITVQNLLIKEIMANSIITNNEVNNHLSFFASDSLFGSVHALVKQANDPILFLPEIDLNLNNYRWKSTHDTAFVKLGENSIHFNNLELTSDSGLISANGFFAFQGEENLELIIKNMNLPEIPGIQLFPYSVTGKLNAGVKLSGTADLPTGNGYIQIINPSIYNIHFSEFFASLNYYDNNLNANLILDDPFDNLINATAGIPFRISFTESVYLPDKHIPVNGKLEINDLNLGKYNGLIPVNGLEINGTVNSSLSIRNTLDNILSDGNFNVTNGMISYKKYGINYSNISLDSHFDSNLFSLDSLTINSGKGNLRLWGTTTFEMPFTGNPEKLNYVLDGKNFQAFNADILKAVVNTRVSVNGNMGSPLFSGNLNIVRSTLNTDIFLKEYNRVYNTSEQPLLVQAQQNSGQTVQPKPFSVDTLKKPPPDIYKNLKGSFVVEIPGNTWIKGKNMNFEISGSMNIIKEDTQVDLFGNLNVKRGFYRIYDRRLDFEEGIITFTGGPSFDPELNFTIAYNFRDPENILRKLQVNITGKVSKPEIGFNIDGEVLEEKEAISYLVFNKGSDQLSNIESSSVAGSNLDMAKDLAIGQVSNLVKNALQSTLGLDVVEISGKKGWSEGSVSIGKYITNNLFLSYERNFALDKKNKVMEPEKITLEYQVLRSLFLQGTNQRSNSGFDFIFKWTWK